MNTNYYPTYPNNIGINSFGNENTSNINNENIFIKQDLPFLQSLLKLNKGKLVNFYYSYPLYNEKTSFNGIIESVGNDYLTLKDTKNNVFYLLPFNNLNYIEFKEKINYSQSTY